MLNVDLRMVEKHPVYAHWLAMALADRQMRLVTTSSQLVAVIAVIFAGCNRGPEYPHASIAGTVTVNGKPVELGTITYFSNAVEGGRVGSATIDNGLYELDNVPQGTVIFTFAASAESGRTILGPDGIPEHERNNIIPKRYASEGITREIEANGTENFDMEHRQ